LGATAAIGFGLMGALTAPLAVCALLLKHDVIAIVYGRGAYTAADVSATATVFASYSYGIVFISFREMLNRIFFSYKLNYVPLIAGIIATIANLSLSYLLSRFLGVSGIALGASVAAFGYATIEFAILFMWKPALLRRELVTMFVAVLLSAVLAYLCAQPAIGILSTWRPFWRLMAVGLWVIFTYGGSLAMFFLLFRMTPSALAELWRENSGSPAI
jgi:peptidoglycan biosynthesis protein MviN/MurJ (putative lipid II flippase)